MSGAAENIKQENESQLIEYARRMRKRAEVAEAIAEELCSHPSCDGTDVEHVFVCMACGRVLRHETWEREGVTFGRHVPLAPDEVLDLIRRRR